MNISIHDSVFSESSLFSPARMNAYIRYYFAANSRKFLLILGEIFVVTFIFFLFNTYASGINRYIYLKETGITGAGSGDVIWNSECQIISFLIVVMLMISGSMMYGAISSRRDRLCTLQIPASQFEKFLTWLIVCLPITVIACWISFWAADICRVLWVKAFTDYGEYARIIPFTDILALSASPVDSPESTLALVLNLSMAIVLNSIFALGGILFHRLSFIKTLLCLFIFTGLSSLMTYFGITIFFDGHSSASNDLSTRLYSTSVILASVSIAISAFFYWLSYARLKEEEIVNRW